MRIENTPMGQPCEPGKLLPTDAMLATDSAPWPMARLSTKARNRPMPADGMAAMAATTHASNASHATAARRTPKRSSTQPAGRQATDPSNVAHRLHVA